MTTRSGRLKRRLDRVRSVARSSYRPAGKGGFDVLHKLSHLPHNSSDHIDFSWLRLNPDDRTLTEHLANDDFVNIWNMLIKAESSAILEDALDFGDDDLRIEILAQEQGAHDCIKTGIRKSQLGRVALLKAQLVAVLGCIGF